MMIPVGHLPDTHPNTGFDEDSKPAAKCEEDNDDDKDKELDPQEDSNPAVKCEQDNEGEDNEEPLPKPTTQLSSCATMSVYTNTAKLDAPTRMLSALSGKLVKNQRGHKTGTTSTINKLLNELRRTTFAAT